jgi:biopolymer transport protein ExbD
MPLIDVVFQLLVFFIATTHFATNEHVLRMDLPPRSAAVGAATDTPAPAETAADPFAYIEDALRIEVLPGGAIRTSAPVAAATNAEALQSLLAQARRDETNPGGSLPPTFPIVIVPLQGTTWHDAVCALNAAAGAGFRNVSFDQPTAEVAK